ncbi:hypothetical protein AAL_04359 [Moelleriella libera RCEF 2490]|uniref:Uncharacterized protein n=1 Tax=Moelleriella libera RCEF 2490 TaxID=1081109 RepID=A0A162INL5_9HYPO|nr:hypothetical protein AAL_04359 [Moelleriella libera RCEF 2490]
MRFITAIAGFAALASATYNAGGVEVQTDVQVIASAHADVGASVDIGAARKKYSGFKCPKSMSYCPWTKACSCPPGQKLDLNANICIGDVIKGAWPEPDISVYATVGVSLGTYCAKSPTKICKYDAKHEYCQASLTTITFVASASIALEIAGKVEVDVGANISADLKNVCGGLTGLYLESVIDACILFNTDTYGLGSVLADVEAGVGFSLGLGSIFGSINSWTCKFGWGNCKADCVSKCTKGCKNYLDVVGEVGAHIGGLVGLCILPNVILCVGVATKIVAHVVDGLLCLVGTIIKTVLSTYNCNCH